MADVRGALAEIASGIEQRCTADQVSQQIEDRIAEISSRLREVEKVSTQGQSKITSPTSNVEREIAILRHKLDETLGFMAKI